MSGGPVDVSVLVTTYRRPRHLALALESLALQQSPLAAALSEDELDTTPAVSGLGSGKGSRRSSRAVMSPKATWHRRSSSANRSSAGACWPLVCSRSAAA